MTTETQNGQQAIEIQPADPQVIYVPTYDPAYVWGPPVWGEYPPLYYPAYGLAGTPALTLDSASAAGVVGVGAAGVGAGARTGSAAGCSSTPASSITTVTASAGVMVVDSAAGSAEPPRGPTMPAHRMGAAYSNAALNSRYGAASQASRIASARSGNYHSFGQSAAGSSYRGTAGNVGSSTAAARHPSQPPVATARKARPAISTSNPDGRLIKPRRNAPILPAGSGTVPLAGSITRRRRLSITLLRPSITPRPAAAAVTATAVAAACRMAPAAVAATPVAAAVTAAAEGNSSIQQSAGGPGRCRPAFLFLSRGTEADCTNGSYSCLFVFIRG